MLEQPSSVVKEDATDGADDHDGAVVDSSDDEPVASSDMTEPTNANTTGESVDDANLTTASADSNASSASGTSNRSSQSSQSNRSNHSAALEPEKEAETEHQQQQQQKLEHRVWYAQFLCLASPLLGGPIAPERVLAMASPSFRQNVDDDESGTKDRPQTSRPHGTFAVAVGACGGLAAWRLAATAPVATLVPMHKVNGQQVSSKPASLDLMRSLPYITHSYVVGRLLSSGFKRWFDGSPCSSTL
jgi:hypothetical protein